MWQPPWTMYRLLTSVKYTCASIKHWLCAWQDGQGFFMRWCYVYVWSKNRSIAVSISTTDQFGFWYWIHIPAGQVTFHTWSTFTAGGKILRGRYICLMARHYFHTSNNLVTKIIRRRRKGENIVIKKLYNLRNKILNRTIVLGRQMFSLFINSGNQILNRTIVFFS